MGKGVDKGVDKVVQGVDKGVNEVCTRARGSVSPERRLFEGRSR